MNQRDDSAQSLDEPPLRTWLLSVLCLISVLIIGVSLYIAPPVSPPTGPPKLGCLTADGSHIDAHVSEIVTLDAEVRYKECNQLIPESSVKAETDPLELPSLARRPPLSKDVTVGGRARLELKSPLFPGTIKPISQEIQAIDSLGDVGTWAWQIRADKPGDHELSLVLSILGPEGNEVVVQNRREEIVLHVEKDFSYFAGVVWRGTIDFLTSLAGAITAVAGALLLALGVYSQMSKRSGEQASKQNEQPVSTQSD